MTDLEQEQSNMLAAINTLQDRLIELTIRNERQDQTHILELQRQINALENSL